MPFQPQFAQQRQAIRQLIRQRRRELTLSQQRFAAEKIAERVVAHAHIKAAHSIAVFLSFDGELDTGPLIEQLWTLGKRVYLPVLHPFNPGHLLFLRYAPETPLVRNRFNILEPRLDVRRCCRWASWTSC